MNRTPTITLPSLRHARALKTLPDPTLTTASAPVALSGSKRRRSDLTPASAGAGFSYQSFSLKRGRGEDGEEGAPTSTAPEVASLLIHFQAVGSDSATGPTLDVPVDITPAQLEILLNQLLEAGDEPTPYAFYLDETEILESLHALVTEQKRSTEEIHTVRYQPLARFRVMPVSRCTDTLPGHEDAVLHVSFSPDGTVLASGGGDATVRFWDTSTCMPKFTCVGHKHHVLATAWSPDGRRFASGDKTGEIRIWDPKTGKELCKPLVGHASWVTSMCWEPHHGCGTNAEKRVELLATASHDKTVRVWNTRTGHLQFTLAGHTEGIESVKWGGEGLMYTASRDRTILVWAVEADRTRAKLVRTLAGHGHRINSLALNTDYLCRTGAFDHRGDIYESGTEGTALAHTHVHLCDA